MSLNGLQVLPSGKRFWGTSVAVVRVLGLGTGSLEANKQTLEARNPAARGPHSLARSFSIMYTLCIVNFFVRYNTLEKPRYRM